MSASEPARLPRTPPGIGPRGRRLWRFVVSGYVLSEHELALLTEAVRVLDDVEHLQVTTADAPLVTSGSRGQDVVNPLRAELRSQRLLLAKLLAQLGLPDLEGSANEWDGLTASARARKAVRARWDNRGGKP